MANPSTTRLDDGMKTLITLGNNPSIRLWEKSVTPPAIVGGGAVDTTTMRNMAWRTQAPKKLKTLGNMSVTVAYASYAYHEIIQQVGVVQEITITFPDSSSIVFRGWVDEFTPGENVEGEQPTATLTIISANLDSDGEELAPVYNSYGP